MCVIFTPKASVSNFKVEKSENLDNAFYVFYVFFEMTLQKNVKSRVFGFWTKRKKRILELCTYCTFLSTLDCKFLCNYPQFWRSYAILSATTQFT